MNTIFCNSAQTFIFDLQQAIDAIWENYGADTAIDSLAYAEKEYGVMQREELREIMGLLGRLKKRVDGLSDECQIIPMEIGRLDGDR